MVGQTERITASDRKRFRALQDIGCVCCLLDGYRNIPAEIHHITEAGRRLGHDHTLPLCGWHHRGVAESVYDHFKGPSLAKGKRDFEERYGKEHDLLVKVNRMFHVEAS